MCTVHLQGLTLGQLFEGQKWYNSFFNFNSDEMAFGAPWDTLLTAMEKLLTENEILQGVIVYTAFTMAAKLGLFGGF